MSLNFCYLVDYFELEKNQIDRAHTSISPLELKLQRIWYFNCMNYALLILLFCYYFPFHIIRDMKCIESPRSWTKGEGQVRVIVNTAYSIYFYKKNNWIFKSTNNAFSYVYLIIHCTLILSTKLYTAQNVFFPGSTTILFLTRF